MSDLELRAVVADRMVDVDFAVAAGEVLAVLGPNGAGKSTALHVIAGLIRPDAGLVRLGDRVLTDTAAKVEVATHDRRVGLLLQDPLLFPHLSVAANVAFGPRSRRGMSRSGNTRESALRWLSEVGAESLANRKPRQLSGGQAQRVAIARALAAEPQALLLDEPLTGLDVAAAAAVRAVLREVVARSGCAVILITHDLLDVLTLADRVLVLESGRVCEVGPAAEVLAAPTSNFGARIAGVNLVSGTVGTDGALHTPAGQIWHGSGSGVTSGDAAVAVFGPSSVAVFPSPPHGSPRNAVEVTVSGLETRGPTVLVRGADQPDGAPGLAASITGQAAAELQLTPGRRVWFGVKAHEVALHPRRRG
ncbi:sulfate/molybdate ABC transporter ATP-binding protein [Mycobacterium vicinigordonae]|uniref:Sulfate/molybdate ABC transporter ATP-binding protein n=1 Tax=Mycobacterium vicinigordonae TaxID=1719132 RepID=A0A7D6DUL2_9MYCO|nr:sulfate/molybdate ABC transporter ATP-binding protein [Mycobacterium vicinigordonae]QLL05164.1 sulfate/molybdate ABC transporter ATP-binding protein [Mycobacterium vicinigordonae]